MEWILQTAATVLPQDECTDGATKTNQFSSTFITDWLSMSFLQPCDDNTNRTQNENAPQTEEHEKTWFSTRKLDTAKTRSTRLTKKEKLEALSWLEYQIAKTKEELSKAQLQRKQSRCRYNQERDELMRNYDSLDMKLRRMMRSSSNGNGLETLLKLAQHQQQRPREKQLVAIQGAPLEKEETQASKSADSFEKTQNVQIKVATLTKAATSTESRTLSLATTNETTTVTKTNITTETTITSITKSASTNPWDECMKAFNQHFWKNSTSSSSKSSESSPNDGNDWLHGIWQHVSTASASMTVHSGGFLQFIEQLQGGDRSASSSLVSSLPSSSLAVSSNPIWSHSIWTVMSEWLLTELRQTMQRDRMLQNQLSMVKKHYNDTVMDWFLTIPRRLSEEESVSTALLCSDLWVTDASFRQEFDSLQESNRTQRTCICRWKMRLAEKQQHQREKRLPLVVNVGAAQPDKDFEESKEGSESMPLRSLRSSSSRYLPTHLEPKPIQGYHDGDDDDDDELLYLPDPRLKDGFNTKQNVSASRTPTVITASMSSSTCGNSTDEDDDRSTSFEIFFSSLSVSPSPLSTPPIISSSSEPLSPLSAPSLLLETSGSTSDASDETDKNSSDLQGYNLPDLSNDYGSLNISSNSSSKALVPYYRPSVSTNCWRLQGHQTKTAPDNKGKKTRAQLQLERQKAMEYLEESKHKRQMLMIRTQHRLQRQKAMERLEESRRKSRMMLQIIAEA